MRVIGLLGGMSWESSIVYEQIINEEVRRRLGGVHSADLIIRSYDFADIERLQSAGDWERAGALLADGARALQAAGAELLVLCTNTMHTVAEPIAAGLRRVGLLGTRYTMERDFYRGRLEQVHHLSVLVPEEPDRTLVHQVIYGELVQGIVRAESRDQYLQVISRLRQRGADGIIAGCTEIELLVHDDQLSVPYFPTTRLHALAAVDHALTGT